MQPDNISPIENMQVRLLISLAEDAGKLIMLLSRSGEIIRFNRTCEVFCGYISDEVCGHLLWDRLLPDSERVTFETFFDEVLRSRIAATRISGWQTKEGDVRQVRFTYLPILTQGGNNEQVAAIGEPADLELSLRRREEKNAFLDQLNEALRPLTDSVAIEAEACRLLGEHLDADRAYYVEVDEKQGQARVHQNCLRGDSPSIVGAFALADVGWTVPYLRRGEAVVVADSQTDNIVPNIDRGWMADLQMHAHISMPVVKGVELMGALCVTEPAPRRWTNMDVSSKTANGPRSCP
ncbi:MAG: PAS domain S-box protein [Caldilineaceae bacterium]|nr:PAS domain S-box protein [Caldilineaceae bacterium]